MRLGRHGVREPPRDGIRGLERVQTLRRLLERMDCRSRAPDRSRVTVYLAIAAVRAAGHFAPPLRFVARRPLVARLGHGGRQCYRVDRDQFIQTVGAGGRGLIGVAGQIPGISAFSIHGESTCLNEVIVKYESRKCCRAASHTLASAAQLLLWEQTRLGSDY